MNIELRHLRYFVAVADAGSFTLAARRVHVTQQVLSSQIRQLEEAIGTRLFDRAARGVTLTPAGAAFRNDAEATLAALDRGVAAARNRADQIAGRLAVGLNMAAASEVPTTLMAHFRQGHPDVELDVTFYDLRNPASGLLDCSSDVAFVRPPVDAPGLMLETVARDDCVFVMPSDHPLAREETLSVADVVGIPWVAIESSTDGCSPFSWRDAWMISPPPGGADPLIGATVGNIDECRELIAAGKGITLCPACVQTHYARPGLACVPSADLPSVTLALAWRADDTRPVVHRFVETVTEAAATARSADGDRRSEA